MYYELICSKGLDDRVYWTLFSLTGPANQPKTMRGAELMRTTSLIVLNEWMVRNLAYHGE